MYFVELGLVLMLITSFVICVALGPAMIPWLHKLKAEQSIRDCGPDSHKKKAGTPTMGGLLIILSVILTTFMWNELDPTMLMALILMLGHALIGLLDDYIKVVKHRNLGLTAIQKLAMQLLLAGSYIYYIETFSHQNITNLWIPGTTVFIELGWVYYVLVVLLLVGTTNAVNLTDGLDGLVTCVSVPVLAAYAVIAYGMNMITLGGFAITLLGACFGFFYFNKYPAQVFMGDTGSLALGGAIAALALLTHTEFLLVIIGAVYVLEAGSVILQVLYFKATGGKRIFRMSPLHHHYELGGVREETVVKYFTLASFIFSAIGLGLWFLTNDF